MTDYISNITQLESYFSKRYGTTSDLITDFETEGIQSFPLRIPQAYADLIDWHDKQDPLRKMVMPSMQEESVSSYELADPIGDGEREVVPGLIHRYGDRCLLLLTSHCRVHCRFCFRREVVGKARPVQFAAIKKYLEEHSEIKEVIFSGGDPATFPPAFLDNVRRQLSGISHIERWRFHSRVPAVDPEYITSEWLSVLEKFTGKKIIVIHINHAHELSVAVKKLITDFLQCGVLVLSQTVLLKGVNDSAEVLTELFTQLVQAGVKPYYLHHLDQAKGTSHFRTSIAAGRQLFQQLRGNLSSVCMPEYVLDLPGGYGKVPVMWLSQLDEKNYQATTFEGKVVIYRDWGV